MVGHLTISLWGFRRTDQPSISQLSRAIASALASGCSSDKQTLCLPLKRDVSNPGIPNRAKIKLIARSTMQSKPLRKERPKALARVSVWPCRIRAQVPVAISVRLTVRLAFRIQHGLMRIPDHQPSCKADKHRRLLNGRR
jgi:hypothetical protein